jgi:uncharacterized protein (DUF58 family)
VGLFYQVQEEVLERLGRVGVAARHAVESILSGQHRSVHRGLSVEFAGHRPYARTDRYNIRVYEEETRLRATLVVDCSGSMAYGRAGRAKLDYARMLGAALGFLMLRQGDAVGLALVDHRVRELVPPGATMGHLLNVLERLENTPAGGETSLASVLDDLADRVKRRGLVILISDTFDDAERLSLALQHLRYRKQDVRVFQILDPEEETFSFRGMHEFIGMESEPRLKLDGDRVRAFYREALEEHCEQLAAGCHASSVALESCSTADDLAMVLVRALTGPGMGRRR